MITGLNPGGVPLSASMPAAVIISERTNDDIGEAAEWLCQAFGFSERLRIGNHRSQLTYGAGAIIIKEKERTPETDLQEMEEIQRRFVLMVRIPNVDRHYQQARRWGVLILKTPTNCPGERDNILRRMWEVIYGHSRRRLPMSIR